MDCKRAFVPPPVELPPSSPWRNWSGTQEVHANRVFRPTSLAELQLLLREVASRNGRARVVATGLSFSDILQADDTLIESTGLLGNDGQVLLPLENELWKTPIPERPLVRVACGARIRHLNATLACAGLAFENLGGYDGQTLVGAISTSTHGSGLGLGPIADGVRSLDLVTAKGELRRIEPATDALTDRIRFEKRYGKGILIQSDEAFWAAVVSMGCFGVIHSVTIQVRSAYRLREVRTMRSWKEVRAELQGAQPHRHCRNYEVLINPYPLREDKDDYLCLVTERELAEPDAKSAPLPASYRTAERLTFTPAAQSGVQDLMKDQPRLIPAILQAGLEQLRSRENIDDSFVIYNVGEINDSDVVSGEYFFPLRCDRYLLGIDKLLAAVAHNRKSGIHHTAPLALRFVKASKAPLSMAHGEDHAAIEMSIFRRQPGAIEGLLSYERACLALDGRPHWGQLHLLTGQPGWLRRAYPAFSAWARAFDRLTERRVFTNHFTERVIAPALDSVPAVGAYG